MPKILLILFCLVGMIFHSQAQTTDDKKIELIFMLDASGSLGEDAYKIQQQGFLNAYNKIYSQYRNSVTTLSVVYFGSSARISAERVSIDDSTKITTALEEPYSGGGTNLTDGLTKVETLLDAVDSNSKPIIILSTDGSPRNKSSAKTIADKLIKSDDNDTEFHASDPDLVSIGIANADLNFLKSISENDVTKAVSIDEFSSKVVELVFGKVAEVVKGLAITAINIDKVSGTNLTYKISCEYKGEPGGYDAILNIKTGANLDDDLVDVNKTQNGISIPSNGTGIIEATFPAPREGVYRVECEVTKSDKTKSDNKSKQLLATIDTLIDTDGDGLADSWEENGLRDANGNVFLALNKLEADKNCADIYLELDQVELVSLEKGIWESVGKDTAEVGENILTKLTEIFLKGDNVNPANCKYGNTGNTGIRLHILQGKNYIAFGKTKKISKMLDISSELNGYGQDNIITWGGDKEEWRRNEVSFNDFVNGINDGENSKPSVKEMVKTNFNFSGNGIFRYSIALPVTNDEDCTTASIGRAINGFPSGVLIFQSNLSTKKVSWKPNTWGPDKGKDGYLLSTIMHELGHTLGLGHGGSPGKGLLSCNVGSDNSTKGDCNSPYLKQNYKPNHFSIMNYSYHGDLRGGYDMNRIDFARIVTKDLDESNLNEKDGLSNIIEKSELIKFKDSQGYLPKMYYYCNINTPFPDIRSKSFTGPWRWQDEIKLDEINWSCNVDDNGNDIISDSSSKSMIAKFGVAKACNDNNRVEKERTTFEVLKGVSQSEWKSLTLTQSVDGLNMGIVPPVSEYLEKAPTKTPINFAEYKKSIPQIDYEFNWANLTGNGFNLTKGKHLLRVALANTGLKDDSYKISAVSNDIKLINISDQPIEIKSNSYKQIVVEVEIPDSASIGDKIQKSLKATSVATSNITDNKTFYITVVADSDGDGIPDEIENANKPHLDANDPSDGAADPDGDGLTNKDEITLFTDPTTADSIPGLTHDQLTVTSMSFTGINGEGKLSIAGGGNTCKLTSVDFYQKSEELTGQPQAPNGWQFDQGLVGFKAENCDAGATLTVTVDYPQAVAAGSVLKKWGKTATQPFNHWYDVSATTQGKTLSYTVTDGGLGDDDLTADGTIVDPAGIANRSRVNPPVQPAQPVQPVPLDNIFWLLVLVLGGSAWHYRRKLII